MKVYAIRGAVTTDGNTKEEIEKKSVELIREIADKNERIGNVISIIVSSTEDLTACYPAKAIRESGILPAPIFSCREPAIENSLPFCIRLLVTVSSEDDKAEARHVYLGDARSLRKDITE